MLNLYDLTVDFSKKQLLAETEGLRFGWKLNTDARGVKQTSYSLTITRDGRPVFDTGIVPDAQSFDICPAVPPLASMTDYTVHVSVTDSRGEQAELSADFSTAPTEEDWADAAWIRPARRISGWSPYLRTKFVTRDVKRAIMYASGLGCAEYTVNGSRTDDFFIDPPFTDYEERVMFRRFDVTGLLRDGGNVLCAQLGEGFYAQSRVWGHNGLVYGPECLRLMLILTHTDGSEERIVSSPETWKTMQSPISVNNIYAGETYDARLEVPGYAEYDSDDAGWEPAVPDETKKGRMTPCNIPPVRILRELPAKTVKTVSGKHDGAWIFDLGENFAGTCEYHLPHSPRGAVYVFRYAETLDKNGALDHRSTGGFATQCIQQDMYICRGDREGEVYRPRFSYHGFRYVEMTGFHDFSDGYGTMPGVGMVKGLQITTDFAKTASFASSCADLDRLYALMDNTYRSNFHGLPEDCPAREKCGWLGDAQVCVNFGLLNYDTAAAYEKYLDDIRTSQKVYGTWQMIAPGKRGCGEATPLWGCAQIIIPYYLWLYKGDREAVTRNFDLMEAWVQHEVARADDCIISVGLGDWCPPEGNDGKRRMPVAHSSTLMFYEIAVRMEELCRVFSLGDSAYYHRLSEQVKDAMIRHFYDREKHTFGYWGTDGTALMIGLYPDGEREALLGALLARIRADGYAMPTGIYANKYLVPALMEAGYADYALDFLFNREKTSFGTMMDDGATTVWEVPDMKFFMPREHSVSSYNHPMHGGFLYTCYTHAAGIRPLAPGFRKFALDPCGDARLETVDASVETPLGTIRVKKTPAEKGFRYALTVPANAECVLVLTGAKRILADGRPVPAGCTLGSGEYSIETEEI